MTPLAKLLDELDHLATVEHALCVEYLFLDCALVERGPGINLAMASMYPLRRLNEALVAAGGASNLTPAAQVRGTPPVAFAPLDATQLDGLLAREYAIAQAVDARYAVVGSLLASVTDLDPDLHSQLTGAIEDGGGHAAAFASLRDELPEKFLRPVREPVDEADDTLRSLSLGSYGLIVRLLEEHFAVPGGLNMLALARDAMTTLRGVMFLLAERNLLPRFD
ncbi:MAG: hypothetical protein ACRDSK_20235 [Actinophytocola sp.]|uniref:hypothetical protein n=1 Tax=Actinophytocola sp. TaxID=1872138 RepID=UPI003D6AF0C0